jgi:hypothetical protein
MRVQPVAKQRHRAGGEPDMFRADRSGYIGASIIGAVVLVADALIARRDLRGAAIVLTIIGATAALVIVWLRAFRIELSTTTLTYRSLTQARTIAIDQVEDVTLTVEPFASAAGPTVRLTVYLAGDREPLVINAKVFSREAIRRVEDLKPAG